MRSVGVCGRKSSPASAAAGGRRALKQKCHSESTLSRHLVCDSISS